MSFDGWFRFQQTLLALFAVLEFAAMPLAAAETAKMDLLDRTSRMSARAERSVLMAVGRAEKRLVAVGEAGIILLSDDNGNQWRQVAAPTSVALTNVRFLSAREGWITGHGGVLLHTRDGGETWTRQLDGRQAAQIDVAAAKARLEAGDPAGQRALADAERQMAEGPDKPLFDVHFRDENNGIVVGAYGLIFATADGGRTWRSLRDRIDNPKGRHLYGIHVEKAQLHVMGEQGALYRSIDGGASFIEIRTSYAGSYFGAVAASEGETVVYGLRGNIFRSVDGNSGWQKIDAGLPVTLTAGTRLADGGLILVDETGRVLESRDAGASFRPLPVPRPSPFTGVIEAADGTLVMTGARGLTHMTLVTTPTEPKP